MNIREQVTQAVEEDRRQEEEREQEKRRRLDDLLSGVERVLGRTGFPVVWEEYPHLEHATPTPMAEVDGYLFVTHFDKDARRWEVRLVWTCPNGHRVWLPRDRHTWVHRLGRWGASTLTGLAEQFEQLDHYAAHPDECPHCREAAAERGDDPLPTDRRDPAHHPDDDADAIAAAEDAPRGPAADDPDEQAGEEPRRYLCTVCHRNPVDAEAGFDTCAECQRRA